MKNVDNILIFIIILTSIIFIKSDKIKTYKYYSYKDIIDIFDNLKNSCKNYIKVTTAQELYNLNFPGQCGESYCITPIVYMSDYTNKSLIKKQIFFSGLVHGDEVLGANVLTEIALFLCEINKNKFNNENVDKIVNNVPIWIRKLLEENEIIFTPMTNSYGYYHKIREENLNGKLLDPNREFPYFAELNNNKLSQELNNECLMTIASKTVNRLSLDNMFITGVSFHGGTSVIGYPWGNFKHIFYYNGKAISTEAPDNKAFILISELLQSITNSHNKGGSSMKTIKNYEIGDMTSTVYAVDGGMEDWAYAGSWENEISKDKVIYSCENSEKINSLYSSFDFSKFTVEQLADLVKLKNSNSTLLDDNYIDFEFNGITIDESKIKEILFAYKNKSNINRDKNINNNDFLIETIREDVKNRSNSLKMFFYLVEMSDDKIPKEDTLGDDVNLFSFYSSKI